jgi:hypothetical protein
MPSTRMEFQVVQHRDAEGLGYQRSNFIGVRY